MCMSLVSDMAPITTFVFLDLETTGFPKEELNKTKITELSLIAVKRSHILETPPGSSPRVQQKLTLCFNPRRVVHPDSTKVTGLCNDLLEHESPFNEVAFDTINSFLNLLSKPVCLIAYNGITYDYPILKKHLNYLNVTFSDDLLCADCLYGFYDIDVKSNEISSKFLVNGVSSEEKNEGSNLTLHQEVDDIQKCNESTPKKSDSSRSNEINAPKKRKHNTGPMDISNARRKIFFGDDSKPQKSYKLKSVYERSLDRPAINAHRAETDCIMALECAVVKAEQFVQWVDNNHCRFADVKPMTVGVPVGY